MSAALRGPRTAAGPGHASRPGLTHPSLGQVQSSPVGVGQQRSFRAWLCTGSDPITVLGQAWGLIVVPPPALGQLLKPPDGSRGILQFRLLKLFQALRRVFPCGPRDVPSSCWMWCVFSVSCSLPCPGCAFTCPGDRERHTSSPPLRLWCVSSCPSPCLGCALSA